MAPVQEYFFAVLATLFTPFIYTK